MSNQETPAAVVVGGSHGIGRAIVEALLARRAEVVLTGTDPQRLEPAPPRARSASPSAARRSSPS